MRTIGFIGVGVMGNSMVRNLLKNGFKIYTFARTKGKVEDVIAEGAVFHQTIASCDEYIRHKSLCNYRACKLIRTLEKSSKNSSTT